MKKALVILPDDNKGKYIAKGCSSAFSDNGFFVVEKKIYDLNIEEVYKINPDCIFYFWSDNLQNDMLMEFYKNINTEKIKLINFAEISDNIPKNIRKKTASYCFSSNEKTKKNRINLGINGKDYKVKFTGYKYSVTFAGNPAYENREELLASIIYNFGELNIFCRSFDFYKSVDELYKLNLLPERYIDIYRSSYRGYVDSQAELAEIFSSSKVNIDMITPEKSTVNYRCFEILASGGFLIAPKSQLKEYLFDIGRDFDFYNSKEELIDKIRFYLKNLNIAQLVAMNGRKNVISNHSFCDRLKSILKAIYGKDFSSR